MRMSDGKIKFTTEDEEIELYVVEQTMIGNINYILAAESRDDESVAYILRQTGAETEDAFYEFVEEEEELRAVSSVFAELLEDADIIL